MIIRSARIAAILLVADAMIGTTPALARHGEGLYGPADDLVVTNFGMGLIVFFILLISVLSGIQYLLERRKEAKKRR